MSSSQKENISL